MSHSVLYKWLSKEERLKVKLFFYQTLNEFLNVSAKQEYKNIFKHLSRNPGIHGSIFHNSEKPLDELGEIAFDLVCKGAGINRHSAKWDELLNNSAKEEYPLYHAIAKAVAIICTNRAVGHTDLPLVSSYDFEQFAEQFNHKISAFDKSLKIYAHVNKKCLKIQRRLNELKMDVQQINTTSNGGLNNAPRTMICSYDFRQSQKLGLIQRMTLLFQNMKARK